MSTCKKLFPFLLLLLIFKGYGQNCSLKGIVRDAENNEPLPFANIKVAGTKIGGITEVDGRFSLSKLDAGFVVLEVSYLGYVSQKTNEILLNKNQTAYIEIALQPQSNVLATVEVRPANFIKREEAPISMQSITTKEIENNPGSNRDVSRVIQSFPGVGSTPAFRNDIIIRGGGPSENRFFLDDVEIPVLNHFATQGASGGPVGIINADFIRNIDFYASSFPSEKYNALSGVLDFKQKDGNATKTNAQLAIGASEASLTLDGPIGQKTTYIASVRRSYLQFLFSAIGLPFLPTFNDYQLKVKTRFNSNNQLTIISIGSLDHLKVNTKIDNPSPSQEAIQKSIPINNQWSYTIGAVYKHFFKKGHHTLVLSRNKLNNELYKYPENDETKPRTFDYLSSETENKLRYEYHLRSGGFKYVLSSNLEYADYNNRNEQNILMLGQIFNLNNQSELQIIKYGFSGHITHRFFENRLLVSGGFRLDGNNYNSKTKNLLRQFSPRLSLSYSLNEDLKLNSSIGRYFQQNAYTTLGYRNENDILVNQKEADFIGVNQYNLGIERCWSDKIMLSVEGFYKDYFNYPIELNSGSSLANQGANYFVYGANPIQFDGKGRSYGVEVLNRLNYKSFSLLASYTFFRSQFTNIDQKYIASAWDSQHLLSITLTKKLPKHWQIGAKWRYVGGLPYTPYDLEQSAVKEIWAINHRPVLNYQGLNSERHKGFHQLDLRVDKHIFFKKWTLMIYFDIQNAYHFQSEVADVVVRQKNADGSYQSTPDGKSYILKSYPHSIGNVLPTLGVMVKF